MGFLAVPCKYIVYNGTSFSDCMQCRWGFLQSSPRISALPFLTKRVPHVLPVNNNDSGLAPSGWAACDGKVHLICNMSAVHDRLLTAGRAQVEHVMVKLLRGGHMLRHGGNGRGPALLLPPVWWEAKVCVVQLRSHHNTILRPYDGNRV